MVSVLDEDPGLGQQLPAGAIPLARSAAIAPMIVLRPGVKPFLIEEPASRGHLGLLVLDGLLARHVRFGQIGATEFLGTGDVFRPWVAPDSFEMAQVRWEILTSTRLAALDREFANRIRPWPELAAALLDRTTEGTYSQLLQAAIRQARRVDDRVLLALWHFAGRWGELTAEGRIVKLPHLTGEVLARIVGARRQSVSTALGSLQTRGAIRRRPDGAWQIPHRPPQLEHLELGHRASDVSPESLQTTV